MTVFHLEPKIIPPTVFAVTFRHEPSHGNRHGSHREYRLTSRQKVHNVYVTYIL
jgi:hypothetical protein